MTGVIVYFTDLKVTNRVPPLTVEESVKRFTSFAGLHQAEMDTHYETGYSGWTGDPSLGITFESTSTMPPAFYDSGHKYDNGYRYSP